MLSVMLFLVIFLALFYAICALIKKIIALFPKKVVLIDKGTKAEKEGASECPAE